MVTVFSVLLLFCYFFPLEIRSELYLKAKLWIPFGVAEPSCSGHLPEKLYCLWHWQHGSSVQLWEIQSHPVSVFSVKGKEILLFSRLWKVAHCSEVFMCLPMFPLQGMCLMPSFPLSLSGCVWQEQWQCWEDSQLKLLLSSIFWMCPPPPEKEGE